jgi:[calcium/calmodulin-dependent protein kinase] kinase
MVHIPSSYFRYVRVKNILFKKFNGIFLLAPRKGVEYLFLNRIIHGDLKPDNLLLADGDIVKVADLGVCNEFLGDDAQIDMRTVSTTPAFRAPETLLSGQKFYFDGKKADIW